ncbi:MAG: ABC transporter permease [Gammaproteobacteria bacterium]|nr:ABC transporter permease [Gammaproteobacteria bacterium]MBI5615316.1 ABC transporter permease [Gammaproteobacteria bacterium]
MKYFALLRAGLLRRKGRTLLTLLSIVAAFVLFGFLDGVRTVFQHGADNAAVDRLVIGSRLSLIQPLPLAHKARIEQVDGVVEVAYSNWFGGIYQDRKNFFPNIAISPEYFDLYPELVIPEDQKKAFLATRTAAIAGRKLAERFGWKTGDRIPLQATIWPHKTLGNTWTFDLVGIMHGTDEDDQRFTNELVFRYDYFDEGRTTGQGTAGWYVVKISDPARAAQIASAIDALFRNSDAETKTQSEKEFNLSFAKQFGDIGLIVSAIMGAVFFTLLLLTGNTMSQGVRERIPELAVLKTLGFPDRLVMGLVLAEALLLLTGGGVLGLALAAAGLPAASRHFGGQIPPLAVSGESWIVGVAIMLLLGLFVGLPPAWRAHRLSIVDALAGH